jgi:hypothetical protein
VTLGAAGGVVLFSVFIVVILLVPERKAAACPAVTVNARSTCAVTSTDHFFIVIL